MPLTDVSLDDDLPIVQALYQRVLDAINDGTLRPGERLIENKLAAAAKVSRTPVREALHRLETEGFIVTESWGPRQTSCYPAHPRRGRRPARGTRNTRGHGGQARRDDA